MRFLTRGLAGAFLVVASVFAGLVIPGSAGAVTNLNVTGCAGGSTALGSALPPFTRVSSTPCNVVFGDTLDTARLFVYQQDGTGQAMPGVPDFSAGGDDWAVGDNAFGACFENHTTNVTEIWVHDVDNACGASNGDAWRSVVATRATGGSAIADTNALGVTTGSVDLRFGLNASSLTAASYSAPVVFEVVAPAVNSAPTAPTLSSPSDGAFLTSLTPALNATFNDPNPGDSGQISFQLCSDSGCATVLQSGTSASGLAVGATGSWTPTTLSRGVTYYWRASSTDAQGAVSTLSVVRSFTINSLATVALVSPADAATTSPTPTFTATHNDGNGHTGTISFQVCGDASCSSVLYSGSSAAGVASGANGTWTPAGIPRGAGYFWRAQSTDSLGEAGPWTVTRSLTINALPTATPTGPIGGFTLPTQSLNAVHSDSNGHTGTVTFQLCSDSGCGTVLQTGSSAAGLASGATGSWTPTALTRGTTYHWRTQSTDSFGETGVWSSSVQFTVNNVPTTALVTPAPGARTTPTPTMTATHNDANGHSGTLSFEVCTVATGAGQSCADAGGLVVSSGAAVGVASGANGSYTAGALVRGTTYHWHARSNDSLGEDGSWAASRSFTVNSLPAATQVTPANTAITGATPTLTATHADGDAHAGTLSFQLCSDAACNSVVQSGSSAAGIANGANGSWTPTALTRGVTYHWRVQSTDTLPESGAWSATRSLTVNTLPVAAHVTPAASAVVSATPVLTASHTDANGHTGTISFQLCSDSACGTVVQSGSSAAGIASGANASWTPAALTRGVTYHWRVQSTDTVPETGSWTATRAFTVNALPVANHVTPAEGAVTIPNPVLTGSHSDANGHTGTVEFEVCTAGCTWMTSGSVAGVANGANASWTVTTALTRATVYYWRVRSVDSLGEAGAWNAWRSLSINSLPTAGHVSPAEGAVTTPNPLLTGSHSDPNGHSATIEFEVCTAGCTWMTSGSVAGIANGANGSWTVPTALTRGTVYYWRVRSVDSLGESGAWNAWRSLSVNTLPTAAHVSPAEAAVTSTTPTLTGSHSDANGHSGTINFEICTAGCGWMSSGNAAGVANGANGSWTVPTALTRGTIYYWRVRSVDSLGEAGAWTAWRSLSANSLPTTAPVSPANGASTTTTPTLTSSHSDANGHSGTIYFYLCADAGCGSVLQTGSAGGVANGGNGSWSPSTLSNSTTYYWRTYTVDSFGEASGWSAMWSFTTAAAANAAPTATQVSPWNGEGLSMSSVTFTATHSDSDGHTGTLQFQVCGDAACGSVYDGGNSAAGLANGTNGSWSTNLGAGLEGSELYWRVRSTDSLGAVGSWTGTTSFYFCMSIC